MASTGSSTLAQMSTARKCESNSMLLNTDVLFYSFSPIPLRSAATTPEETADSHLAPPFQSDARMAYCASVIDDMIRRARDSSSRPKATPAAVSNPAGVSWDRDHAITSISNAISQSLPERRSASRTTKWLSKCQVRPHSTFTFQRSVLRTDMGRRIRPTPRTRSARRNNILRHHQPPDHELNLQFGLERMHRRGRCDSVSCFSTIGRNRGTGRSR
jgi:hypothetical protein